MRRIAQPANHTVDNLFILVPSTSIYSVLFFRKVAFLFPGGTDAARHEVTSPSHVVLLFIITVTYSYIRAIETLHFVQSDNARGIAIPSLCSRTGLSHAKVSLSSAERAKGLSSSEAKE